MKRITFKYRDEYTNGRWNTQSCVVSSLSECIKLYGLNECEYEIISIENV